MRPSAVGTGRTRELDPRVARSCDTPWLVTCRANPAARGPARRVASGPHAAGREGDHRRWPLPTPGKTDPFLRGRSDPQPAHDGQSCRRAGACGGDLHSIRLLSFAASHPLLRKFPGVTLELFEAPRPVLEQAIVDGALDVAVMLVSNLENRNKISSEILKRSPRRLWVAPSHPLTRLDRVSLRDIEPHPYLMLTVDEAKITAMRYWAVSELEPKVIFRTASVEAVRSMVASRARRDDLVGYGLPAVVAGRSAHRDAGDRRWGAEHGCRACLETGTSLPTPPTKPFATSCATPRRALAKLHIDACKELAADSTKLSVLEKPPTKLLIF